MPLLMDSAMVKSLTIPSQRRRRVPQKAAQEAQNSELGCFLQN